MIKYSLILLNALGDPRFSIPLALIVGIALLTYLLFKKQDHSIKINNIPLHFVYLLIYVGFYVGLIFLIRYLQLGNNIDVKNLFNNTIGSVEKLSTMTPFYQFLTGLTITTLILIWLLVIWKIRKILEHKIWCLHLYYTYILGVWPEPMESIAYWTPKLHLWYSTLKTQTLTWKILAVCRKYKISMGEAEPLLFALRTQHKIYLFLLVSICIVCLSELILCNWVLHYTIYYFFPYVIAMTYVRVSRCINNSTRDIESILMEMAYRFPFTVYVNLTEKEYELLLNYIKSPYYISVADTIKIPNIDGFSESHPLKYLRRFDFNNNAALPTVNNKQLYANWNINDCFGAIELWQIDGKYFVEDENNPLATEYYKKLKEKHQAVQIFKPGDIPVDFNAKPNAQYNRTKYR